MPRKAFEKQHKQPTPPKGEWVAVLAEAKAEGARGSKVSQATRLTYERNAKTLAKGWDLATAPKGTRCAMKSAGIHTMAKQLRKLVAEAERVRKEGETGEEMHERREAQFALRAKAVRAKLAEIRAFDALPWNDYTLSSLPGEMVGRVQKSHKQKAATDADLAEFFKTIPGDHEMRLPMLVTEFTGVRGEELGTGVRIELENVGKRLALRFFIESAKCDGGKKGLDLRSMLVFQPDGAKTAVLKRWSELAKAVSKSKNRLVVKVESTSKQSVGVRITQYCADNSIRAGVHVAAYSLRHRVSAQAKQSGDAESVALVLGHQTTKTQVHYGRSKRGGGAISPVSIVGVNVSGSIIRGAPIRSGPGEHIKQQIALGKLIPMAQSAPARVSKRL